MIFLNTTNLICRSTDISKCFLGSLRFRDNESRLYNILEKKTERNNQNKKFDKKKKQKKKKNNKKKKTTSKLYLY